MQSLTSPGQLSFDDFLNFKTPTTASGNDANSLSFSLIPPTPHDMRGQSFASPLQYAPSVGSGLPFELQSPPPFGGIMSPKMEQQPSHTLRPVSGFRSANVSEHRRSCSISSQGHRHEPYKHASRQSSISSLSGAVLGSDGNSSDWQWESGVDEGKLSTDTEALSSSPINAGLSICPADLQSINPGVFRNQNSFATFVAENSFPPKSGPCGNQEDSDSQSDQESDVGTSRIPHSRQNAPKLQAVPLSKIKREVSPASTRSERSAPNRRARDTKPSSYREESEVPDSPILVTAITSSGKKSHARKRPQDHIPRPRNAFILFRKHVVDSKLIPPEVEIRHQNISVVVAKMWAEADTGTKSRFQEQARLEKEQHMRDYPNYKYQPVYRRSQVVRRQIKADPVEEKKCALVANLLLDGKNGDELKKETKRAVERSNKQRAKVARSLAEARARSSHSRRHSRMRSDSQSVYGSESFPVLTDREQAIDDGYTNVTASTPVTQHAGESSGTPSTARAAPSVVSELRHQLATQDFMQSTSVSRMSQQRPAPQQQQYVGPSHTIGNGQMAADSYVYHGDSSMMFDPQDIFALNQQSGQSMQQAGSRQQQMQLMAPPSHYVLAMNSDAAALQFVQQNDLQHNNQQFNIPMPMQQQQQQHQMQPAPQSLPQQQDPMLWPPMSDEDLLGYADAFNMLNDYNGNPWPNMM